MTWKGVLVGFALGIIAVCLAVYAYFAFGFVPVAASAAPLPFEQSLVEKALNAQMKAIPAQQPPFQPSERIYMDAATEYREHCALCHGLPGESEPQLAKNMFPNPPQLFSGKGVTDDPPYRIRWVIQHGIRLSGMAAFDGILSDNEIWEISELLANADDLPPQVESRLRAPQETSARK